MTGYRSGLRSISSRDGPGRPRAKKRFGQHFLSDVTLLTRIVDAADLTGTETVLEVGPGLGALTAVLADHAARVVAVEIDRDLIHGLRERLHGRGNVTVVEGDILERPVAELLAQAGATEPYVVVANLPYNIAAPVLRRFFEGAARPRRMVVMVQLEVGEAMAATPGRMSLMSVATQVYGDARVVMKLPPGAFSPPPKVHSAVVRVDVLSAPRVDVPVEAFFRVVRAGFGNPRKQLRNSLSFGLHVKQDVIDNVMKDAGIDATLRPQMLSIDDWQSIARVWIRRNA